MPATATAARTRPQQVRSSRAAEVAPRRRTGSPRPLARVPLAAVPAAVGHTAGAVRGLADSRSVMTITRTRLWIGMLAVLLAGIVALNVASVSVSSSSSRSAELADQLRNENASLAATIAGGLSGSKTDALIADEGMYLPNPDGIYYLSTGSGDAAEAARRLAAGELTAGIGAGLGTDLGGASVYDYTTTTLPDPTVTGTTPTTSSEATTQPTTTTTTSPTTQVQPTAPTGGGATGGAQGGGSTGGGIGG